jgi:hypothetical protein
MAPGRGRWAQVGGSAWTVVVHPDAGWWPRAVTRIAATAVCRLVGLAGGSRWLPQAVVRLAGGRLVEPVRLCDPDEDDLGMPSRFFVLSADAADRTVEHDPSTAGLVHELLWHAGRPATSATGDWASAAHERDADEADVPCQAWVQFVLRVLSLRAGQVR